jgi:hypothetical protein
MLLGSVALAALSLGAAGAIARHGSDGWGQHRGGHQGGFFGGGMGRMGMLCREGRAAEMADHMLVRIEHKVKPTEAQKAVFEELKTAARSAVTKAQAGCPVKAAVEPAKEGTPPPRPSPIERLANAEAMTAATLEAIKTVRPAAEKFYAALSDEQKAAINERRGGKWGRGGWHRGDRHGPDRGKAPGASDRGHDRGPGSDDGDPDTLP